MAKRQKAEPKFSQGQPYDSSFKMLLDDQTLALLSFFLGLIVVETQELKEALFKKGMLKPSLRVDALYLIRILGKVGSYIAHIEFETAPDQETEPRLVEYFGLLYRKHRKTILQVLVSPFVETGLPTSPLLLKMEEQEISKHRYIVVALPRLDAQKLLDQHLVDIYVLIPAMGGASYEVLVQALNEMEEFYKGQEDRFHNHLLWFDALLERTTTVTQQDKERIRKDMGKYKSLLDESFFVRQGREEGRQEVLQQAPLIGLRQAIVDAVGEQFPKLARLAKKMVSDVEDTTTLRHLLVKVSVAQTEEEAKEHLLVLALDEVE